MAYRKVDQFKTDIFRVIITLTPLILRINHCLFGIKEVVSDINKLSE
jgi:hypothetical protein